MKIALAQINPIIGDLTGNLHLINQQIRIASRKQCDLIVFPELCVTGYPPRDLVENRDFVAKNRAAVEQLAQKVGTMGVIVGFVDLAEKRSGRRLANAAALLHRGRILAVRHKSLLPTYDVFDELRHFEPARQNMPVSFKGRRLGITICEDMWNAPGFVPDGLYGQKDPVKQLSKAGAEILLNLSSSPFHRLKNNLRHQLIKHHVETNKRPFLFVNQVGGNDELIFDGNSFALDGQGQLLGQAKGFATDLIVVDTIKGHPVSPRKDKDLGDIEAALILGLRDYVRKCNFENVVLGLSGGIDSAVTAALAVRALGKNRVMGLLMPSEYSSRGSLVDAQALARNLGIDTQTISITPIFAAFKKSLRTAFKGLPSNVAEENLQARIRGTLLMAFSNKFGALLLTTGNKSELSMGYCTLYGDMNGGLAVISDVPKMMVYALGRHLNKHRAMIPENSFTKPPSAELRPNQTDQDSLPPYDILDGILEAYVEEGKEVADIVRMDYPDDMVRRVLSATDRNEYKRRQSAPGLKITPKAFGLGRRLPIARGFWR